MNQLVNQPLTQAPRTRVDLDHIDHTQVVTLDQIAASVHLKKATLRNYVRQMPAPLRPGVRGRPALWYWPDVRLWLIRRFGVFRLPERFPNNSL